MSEQTKRIAQDTEYYLRKAENKLIAAEQSSKGVGDKSLTQKVNKLRESVHEVRKELDKKINNG
jgi:hypothetical protein